MSIRVLFFGATSSITGKREIDVKITDPKPVGEIFDDLLAAYPRLAAHKLLLSVNQSYASTEDIVRDGDEIAIFTAVSGG